MLKLYKEIQVSSTFWKTVTKWMFTKRLANCAFATNLTTPNITYLLLLVYYCYYCFYYFQNIFRIGLWWCGVMVITNAQLLSTQPAGLCSMCVERLRCWKPPTTVPTVRNSRSQMFFKIIFLRIFQYSQESPSVGVQKRLQHNCFPGNIVKFLRTRFLITTRPMASSGLGYIAFRRSIIKNNLSSPLCDCFWKGNYFSEHTSSRDLLQPKDFKWFQNIFLKLYKYFR